MSNETSIVTNETSIDLNESKESLNNLKEVSTNNEMLQHNSRKDLNESSIVSNDSSLTVNDSSIKSNEDTRSNDTLSHESYIDSNECMLSTFDNPFNPFEQFDNWFMFDIEKGYYSSAKLDRLTNITDDMSEKEYNEEVERAIDTFLKHDFTNTYTKVRRNTKTPVVSM